MQPDLAAPSPTELQQVSERTLELLETRRRTLKSSSNSFEEISGTLTDFITTVERLDPIPFSEDDIIQVSRILSAVIGGLEAYLDDDLSQGDSHQRQSIADVTRFLNEARSWIAQGYSPDPKKRPTNAELNRLTDDCAKAALDSLTRA